MNLKVRPHRKRGLAPGEVHLVEGAFLELSSDVGAGRLPAPVVQVVQERLSQVKVELLLLRSAGERGGGGTASNIEGRWPVTRANRRQMASDTITD